MHVFCEWAFFSIRLVWVLVVFIQVLKTKTKTNNHVLRKFAIFYTIDKHVVLVIILISVKVKPFFWKILWHVYRASVFVYSTQDQNIAKELIISKLLEVYFSRFKLWAWKRSILNKRGGLLFSIVILWLGSFKSY